MQVVDATMAVAVVQGGVTKAELQIGAMGGCGDALVFAPAEGDASGVIQNVHVTHSSAIHVSSCIGVSADKVTPCPVVKGWIR